MSNLGSKLKKLKALHFPSWDIWFIGLDSHTLEGMIAYLEISMKSAKAAFNAGETEISFAPPAEYKRALQPVGQPHWSCLDEIVIATGARAIPLVPILQQARNDLASAEPTIRQDTLSFLEGPVA